MVPESCTPPSSPAVGDAVVWRAWLKGVKLETDGVSRRLGCAGGVDGYSRDSQLEKFFREMEGWHWITRTAGTRMVY